MNQIQLSEKVLELINRYRSQMRIIDTPIGYHYEFGPIYLRILGNVCDTSTNKPSLIDIKFNGKDIGRLEPATINPYYPSPNDPILHKINELYRSICEFCKNEHLAKKNSDKESLENEFLFH